MISFVEVGRGQMVTVQHLVVDLDGDHLWFDVLGFQQIEDGPVPDLFGLSIDLDLHGFSQVGLEIKEF